MGSPPAPAGPLEDEVDARKPRAPWTIEAGGSFWVAVAALPQGRGADDKHPLLSDLRESGTIEQDADVVMFVYREEYYLERSDKKGSPDHVVSMGKAEVIIAKQRHGPTGTANLAFNGAYTKFSDLPEVATQ